ncbi:MAG: hypothetical protein HS117_06185 [Verrucomicrobiaceae bacterium]|nr:hypothetical protein [Verrucomicrobiaceae bacterium]
MINRIFLPLQDDLTCQSFAPKNAIKHFAPRRLSLTDCWIAAKLAQLRELRSKLTVSTGKFAAFPYAWKWSANSPLWDIDLLLQIAVAERELRYVVSNSVTSHSDACVRELSKLRKVVTKAKHVINLVCSGLQKLGAPITGIRLNFLTGFLFPKPRNDVIYA